MSDLDAAVGAIQRGGVIAIPTDTVYGLACDPTNVDAVARIYAIKDRPDELELTLLAATQQSLEQFVIFDDVAKAICGEFWPGALSIILPVGQASSELRLAIPRRGTTLSVRVPNHERLRQLLAETGPLATTSANRHGLPPAKTAAEVQAALAGEIELVVEGGSGGGLASTIIDCVTLPARIVRQGPISTADLEPFIRRSET